MNVEIVTIGNEVLSGRTVDTNFASLARALEATSVQVQWHSTVGDTAERIAEGLARALDRADAVVMTGGLGPTPDDVTRKAVATLLGRPLQLDEKVLEAIRERGRKAGRKLPATVETMALIPRGAEVWMNPVGAAPGLLMLQREKPVVLLPGVPMEMEALCEEYLVPYLRSRTGRAIQSFTLRTYGSYESQLHERIGPLDEDWPGASLAYLPSYFGVDLRVTVAGNNEAAVRETTLRAYNELMARVRGVVYAEGGVGMEEVVGAALREKGWRIATAESCTAGLLSKRLTDTAGSSAWFERGWATYANDAKIEELGVDRATLEAQGAVSAAVAEQMAEGARRNARTEVGVAVTGVAGPEGGSDHKPVGTVFVSVVSPLGTVSRLHRLFGTRATIRERAAQTALDMVRRHVTGLPVDPGFE